MVLDEYVRDYKAFMEEFATALDADTTTFYLDTSLLIWLIRLGAEARMEVIRWFQSRLPSTVRVPVWAAHELHRHVIDGTASRNLRETVSQAQAKYDDFVRMATERADNLVCTTRGFADRSAFIRDLEHSHVKFNQLARVVELDEAPLRSATKEVIDFANANLLSTDLGPIIHKLNSTGGFRTSHFIPPGFQDRKDENKYGDLVIWEEIIQDLVSAGTGGGNQKRDVVFVSRDKKTDWVSAAPFVLNLKGETQKCNRDTEMDVSRAHPFLVHELTTIAGGQRLHVTQPGFLASAIDFAYRRKAQPSQVSNWLAAAHRPDLLGKLASITLGIKPGDQPSGQTLAPPASAQPSAVPAEKQDVLASFTLRDVVPITRAETSAYLSALPAEQIAVIQEWMLGVSTGSFSPVKLGRIFADLVLARTPGFADQIPALIERLFEMTDRLKVNQAVLAMTSAAYFDRYSELLRRPAQGLGILVLALEPDDKLKPAYDVLHGFLTTADAALPYLPGAGRPQIVFLLDFSGSSPKSVIAVEVL